MDSKNVSGRMFWLCVRRVGFVKNAGYGYGECNC